MNIVCDLGCSDVRCGGEYVPSDPTARVRSVHIPGVQRRLLRASRDSVRPPAHIRQHTL